MNLSAIFDLIGGPPPVFEGNGWAAHCPAHADTKPSLRVAIAKDNGTLLLKCRAGCETNDVLEAMGLSSFADIGTVVEDVGRTSRKVNDTGEPVGMAEQARLAAHLHEAHERFMASAPDSLAVTYLANRFGIDRGQAGVLGVGVDDGSSDWALLGFDYNKVSRLVVPFRDFDGIPRYFQGRDLHGTAKAKWSGPSTPEEGSWSRYAFMEAGTGMDYVVVTEGPGDALASVGAGFDTVAIRGASMAPSMVDPMAEALTHRRIVLAGDNDDAGQTFNRKLGEGLTEKGMDVYVLQLPVGIGDVGEWFEADPAAFVDIFQKAVADAPSFASEVDPPKLDLTHLTTHQGLARYIQQWVDGDVLHAQGVGFFLWQAGAWRHEKLKIRSIAHEAADNLWEEYQEELETEKALLFKAGLLDEVAKLMKAHHPKKTASKMLRNAQDLNYVLTELAAMVDVPLDTFDSHHHLLSVANGTVDLRTGKLRPHRREDRITNRLDVDFDPDARADRWERFLVEVFPENPDLPDYIQRLTGYGITGSTREQCFVIHWGRGANGKSIFTDALADVFGQVTETTPFSTFETKASGGIPNDVAALRGARLVFASEGEVGVTMAEAMLKRLTGQDLVTARFMREEFFSFRPNFLIQMATNHKPSFRGQDEGLWRRVKLIPWVRYFAPEDRDHYLGEKLQAEREGILAWAVRGAVEWFANGIQDPPSVVDAIRNYKETSDALSGLIPDVLDATGDREDWVSGSDAFKLYERWADDEELPNKERWSRRAFYNAMEERGAEKIKRNVGVVLVGMKVAGPSPMANDSSTPTDSIFPKEPTT